MSFLSGGIRGLKKLADPLGLINKKNKIDLKNWKDPLTLFSDPKKRAAAAAAGGAGGVGRANPGMDNSMQNAFAQQLPAMLGQQSLFARPEAAQFLAQQQGVAAPPWAGGPPPPMPQGAGMQPGTMYAGGNPNFDESGGGQASFDAFGNVFGGQPGPMAGFGKGMMRPPFMAGGGIMANPFMAAIQGQRPGPPPDMASILARFRGTLGNGGGVTMPTSQRNLIDGGGRVGPRRFQLHR